MKSKYNTLGCNPVFPQLCLSATKARFHGIRFYWWKWQMPQYRIKPWKVKNNTEKETVRWKAQFLWHPVNLILSLSPGVSNRESRMWICKPTGMNQGRGIFLLKSKEDIAAFRLKLKHMEDRQFNRKMHYRQPQAYIVQQLVNTGC